MLDLTSFQISNQTTKEESIYVMSNDRYSNINQMATFPASADKGIGTSQDKFSDLLTVDFDYDYSQVPMNYDSKSFWEELAEPVQDAGSYVWDTATGTWESVKESASAVGSKVASVVDSAGNSVSTFYSNIIDSLKENLIFVVVILLAVIWILAKSGILSQIAELLSAAK